MMRYLFCYMVVGILFCLQGYSQTQRDIPDSAFILIDYLHEETAVIYFYDSNMDEKPYLKEGKQSVVNWFHSNINYPSELLEHDLKMNYYLFVVADTSGRISLEKLGCGMPRHRITYEEYPLLKDSIARRMEDEILKAMDSFPLCEPGIHRGKKVAVHLVLLLLLNPSVNQQKGASLRPFCIPIFPSR